MLEEPILWFALPIGGLVITTYLLVTGLRDVFIPWRVVLGAALLIAICALAGYSSSRSVDLGLIAFINALLVTPFAIGMGIFAACSLPRWRRLGGAVIGVLFPVALSASIIAGLKYAPEPPTLEETYITRTERLLDDLQENPESFEFTAISGNRECQNFLLEGLWAYRGQYSLEITALVDPDRDPVPTGSSEAVVAVRFPDGGEAELHYYNYTYERCEIINQ